MFNQLWDERFMLLARHISQWSKDPSTKVGAVLVGPDRVVRGMGFNGFPRGVGDDPATLADRPAKYARVVHAEVNAVLQAGRDTAGSSLYVWPPGVGPTCDRCAAVVIQAGVARVVGVCIPPGIDDGLSDRWREANLVALEMYGQAGTVVTMLNRVG
jgi:dCMP deaminase